jgi:hypothetical protein
MMCEEGLEGLPGGRGTMLYSAVAVPWRCGLVSCGGNLLEVRVIGVFTALSFVDKLSWLNGLSHPHIPIPTRMRHSSDAVDSDATSGVRTPDREGIFLTTRVSPARTPQMCSVELNATEEN